MIKPLFSNIVVAVSGSDASILAAKYAIVMAKLYRCRLSAAYVVDTATIRQLTLSKIFIQEESLDYEKSLEANGERYLSFVEELARAKGVKIEREMRRGAVYTEILGVADEKKADLIVLGGWEKDRSARDIISHAHREIMVNAKCSVFLVKEPSIDQIYKQA
ncbi:universal stress protein [Treponema sp. TIM-1]|jgi:nucleotide-binding universal stress UspA family protein|uniref:universal stress protein n=1 Tax=Treponema sp. TIM-1 TaxID=2898417 RepID=UPI002843647A|nr:universal stress protein [Spirochaetaceae bacterium]